jgi:hypothetical protein
MVQWHQEIIILLGWDALNLEADHGLLVSYLLTVSCQEADGNYDFNVCRDFILIRYQFDLCMLKGNVAEVFQIELWCLSVYEDVSVIIY